jgi:uncharacterized membrane protein YfcA
MHFTGVTKGWASALTLSLGIGLLLTAVTVAYRQAWSAVGLRLERVVTPSRKPALTVACGLALGVLVSLSSIGAGAIGATLILLLNPRIEARRIVGTDIAHAVPLTLLGGLGHLGLGNVDTGLLLALLCGSIPGILVGARLAGLAPEWLLRPILAITLCYAAWTLFNKG